MYKKTLIAIGDPSLRKNTETSSFSKFKNYSELLKEKNIRFIPLSYKQLFKKNLPKVKTDYIIILLFFPYIHWNKNIEVYTNGEIYGDNSFGNKFNKFFNMIDKYLRDTYKNKKLIYVNPPHSIKKDRDKKIAKRIFIKNNIPTPHLHNPKSSTGVLRILNKGNDIFIKPRYGAMGKGVSYLENEKWRTNFICKDGKIKSPLYDYRWEFNEVTGNRKFLDHLLKSGFIFEDAIKSPIIGGKKIDLRFYVVYGKVPYIYARTVKKEQFITNWSQGGTIEKGRILNKIPPEKLEAAKRLAIKTAKSLKMNFCGIDIIFSEGFKKTYVLEAQSFPSFERGFDLFKYLIECL